MKIPCYRPFTSVLIDNFGNVFFCCMSWQVDNSLLLGNLKDSSLAELWNNEKAQEIRKAMYENKISKYCSERTCPIRLSNCVIDVNNLEDPYYKNLFTYGTVTDVNSKNLSMSSFPSYIAIGIDNRCNLDCIMCTVKDVKGLDYTEIEKTLSLLYQEIDGNREDVRRIFLSASGEPLLSKNVLNLLKKTDCFKHKMQIELLSNGNLLTPELFDQIKHNNFFSMAFSVDAASEATYEKIRRKGNWKQLMENFEYLSKHRKENSISHFEINMTVMKLNYREIYDFVALGEKLGCDQVQFHPMRGTSVDQNILEPEIDWEAVKFIQDFLVSKEAASPKVYCAGLQIFLPEKLENVVMKDDD